MIVNFNLLSQHLHLRSTSPAHGPILVGHRWNVNFGEIRGIYWTI